ncbi:hypothetical protein IQ255_04310 [Pleurocapsales cyanobacterium LEGE 10410]|nr:hypothetical protein [Pleurocapsales cyanobacterium LEGE 10410]
MTQPFYFSDGSPAHNANELLELCQQHPDEATSFLVRQDLEKWLAYIGSYELAECAANARQTESEDRQKLEEFLNRSYSITSSKPVPAAVSEMQNSDMVTKITSNENLEEITKAENIISSPPEETSESVVDDSKDVAVAESALIDNEAETSTAEELAPARETNESVVDESKDLAVAESALKGNSEDSTSTATAKPSKQTAGESSTEEKLSFFQVIAKFIVKILYRNKA